MTTSDPEGTTMDTTVEQPTATPAAPTAARQPVRTAVVIVHGMGEQLPLETLNRFVGTALPKVGGERRYYSRPARITESYEARRMLAFRQAEGDQLVHGQAEFFEYHWSYLMTGNRLGDMLPTMRRMLLRSPTTVPTGLRVVWWVVWVLLVVLAALLVWLVVAGVMIKDFTFPGVLAAVLTALLGAAVGGGIVATLVVAATNWVGGAVAKSFVDVVRYLDRSPRSYEVRRAIRKGMVDLLRALQDEGRYSRVVVVAHSLGAYIAYDGITSLWSETSRLHGGPITEGAALPLAGLTELEQAAATVLTHPDTGLDDRQRGELAAYRDRQFALWKATRAQGNPWLVTDFVSVGTPMYFADLLYTKNRRGFVRLANRGELPLDPPLTTTRTVEASRTGAPKYGWANRGRTVLGSDAPFAVVRWTNLYFPVTWGRGDWFGGPLRPLFGRGILDLPVLGNLPGRRAPGLAHGRYFDYPDAIAPDDVATVLREALALGVEQDLVDLLGAPDPLADTATTL